MAQMLPRWCVSPHAVTQVRACMLPLPAHAFACARSSSSCLTCVCMYPRNQLILRADHKRRLRQRVVPTGFSVMTGSAKNNQKDCRGCDCAQYADGQGFYCDMNNGKSTLKCCKGCTTIRDKGFCTQTYSKSGPDLQWDPVPQGTVSVARECWTQPFNATAEHPKMAADLAAVAAANNAANTTAPPRQQEQCGGPAPHMPLAAQRFLESPSARGWPGCNGKLGLLVGHLERSVSRIWSRRLVTSSRSPCLRAANLGNLAAFAEGALELVVICTFHACVAPVRAAGAHRVGYFHVGEEIRTHPNHASVYTKFDFVFRTTMYESMLAGRPAHTAIDWSPLGPGDVYPRQGTPLNRRLDWPLHVGSPVRAASERRYFLNFMGTVYAGEGGQPRRDALARVASSPRDVAGSCGRTGVRTTDRLWLSRGVASS